MRDLALLGRDGVGEGLPLPQMHWNLVFWCTRDLLLQALCSQVSMNIITHPLPYASEERAMSYQLVKNTGI